MGRERKAPVAIVLRPVAGSVTTNAAGAVALLGKRMLAAARGPDHRPILEMLMVSIDIRGIGISFSAVAGAEEPWEDLRECFPLPPSPPVRGVLGRKRLRGPFVFSASPQVVTYSVAKSVLLLEQPCCRWHALASFKGNRRAEARDWRQSFEGEFL
jgi:hypothetical protein